MNSYNSSFQRRVESIKIRINNLGSLRNLVGLKSKYDLTDQQWSVLELQLSTVKSKLLSKLKKGARKYFQSSYNVTRASKFNAFLGEIELEMTKAFEFFATYADILTQRLSLELGPPLTGCDILAWDALNKDNPALNMIEHPLVYCDRGFGASTLREGVMLPDNIPNPLPLIQIPYSRLKEKYNLTSILHEAGHEAMVRLDLTHTLPKVFNRALSRVGAPEPIKDLYTNWSTEIGPDFWAFCCSGLAQPATIMDILSLPPNHVFRVSWMDPHPPAYLRFLLSTEWCRQAWGNGIWDEWEKRWLDIYPLENASQDQKAILNEALIYIPLICRTLLRTRFKILDGKPITSLFKLSTLAPSNINKIAKNAVSKSLDFRDLSPTSQLAVFRILRDKKVFNEQQIDDLMTKWLLNLGKMKQ